ncbi:DNA mismatch repair protein MutS, partial [Flavobacteriaceae bacterium (ex Bugula neritina AB1)]
MNNPQQYYTSRIDKHYLSLNRIKKQLIFSSSIRLIVFLGTILGIYLGYPNTQIIMGIGIIGLSTFIFLISRHSNLMYAKNKLQKLIEINQLELDVLKGDYSKLDSGKEFIDPTHPYSHDIDLFGNNSFFQYSNRTTTFAGKYKLAAILRSNTTDDIKRKQDAIKNLSEIPDWRQEFSAIASLVNITTPITTIRKWLLDYQSFVPKIMKVLPGIISGISAILVVLLFLEIITFQIFLYWFFIGLAITGSQLKKINQLYSHANKVKDTFEQYYKLVDRIESMSFASDLLKEKQQNVINNKRKASGTLKQFAKILDAFDQRNNMIYGIFANGLLLWDIMQSYRIEKWITANKNNVDQWFQVIAFFDAYNSLGNFAFNNPSYIYPKITTDGTILDTKNLGHPMLDTTKRVDNDIHISEEQFFIITGANMAGKSTFLRTVALQIIMSNTGLPVCASSCIYKPTKLITSMRTSDSLNDDASYFFAELTQLKRIVDALKNDTYFIILDEILKGTNSK